MCLATIYAAFLVLVSCVLDVAVVHRDTLKQTIVTLPRLKTAIDETSIFSASTLPIVRALCLLIVICIVPGIVCALYLRNHKELTRIGRSSNKKYKYGHNTVDSMFCDSNVNDRASGGMTKRVFKPWYLNFDSFSSFDTNIQHVRPASFEKYFSEVLSLKNRPTHEVMKYEWARYETFKDFPVSSPAIPMRLSQAGFYYTGTEDETACFSCGVKHRNWKSRESPLVVHKSKSPGCQFINGNDTTNVPIDNTETQGNRTETSTLSRTSQSGPEGGPFGIQQNIAASSPLSVPNTNSASEFLSPTINHEERRKHRETSNRFGVEEYNGRHCESEEQQIFNPSTANSETNTNRRSNRQYQDNTSNTEDLGINFGRPKRPEFAVLAVRLSTFKGWPRSVQQQPRDLADAGFYYAGYGDCVRCFHCGGGLRNWEYGDEPWTEHARWYPRCAHVRLCKGDEFIELIQQELQEVEAVSSAGETNNASALVATQSINKEEDPLERVSAISLIEMGYSESMVRGAAETFKRQTGHFQFTAQELMEIILDTEENVNTGDVLVPLVEESEREQTEGRQAALSNVISSTEKDTEKLASWGKEPDSKNENMSSDARASLLDENRQLKEQMTCKICLDGEACVVFLPCSHMVACPQCAPALRKCPICRKLVRGTVRAYLS